MKGMDYRVAKKLGLGMDFPRLKLVTKDSR